MHSANVPTSAPPAQPKADDLYLSDGHPARAYVELHYGSEHNRVAGHDKDPVNLPLDRLEALRPIHSGIKFPHPAVKRNWDDEFAPKHTPVSKKIYILGQFLTPYIPSLGDQPHVEITTWTHLRVDRLFEKVVDVLEHNSTDTISFLCTDWDWYAIGNNNSKNTFVKISNKVLNHCMSKHSHRRGELCSFTTLTMYETPFHTTPPPDSPQQKKIIYFYV